MFTWDHAYVLGTSGCVKWMMEHLVVYRHTPPCDWNRYKVLAIDRLSGSPIIHIHINTFVGIHFKGPLIMGWASGWFLFSHWYCSNLSALYRVFYVLIRTFRYIEYLLLFSDFGYKWRMPFMYWLTLGTLPTTCSTE